MSKHTPGPWELEATGTGEGVVVFQDGSQDAIATVWDNYPEKENDANARLISAAPDLLAFCEKMEGDTWFMLLSDDLANQLRAALAKARGEQE